MGIKTKIIAGFTVIALLLFISGLIAIYELKGVGSSMRGLLRDNLRSIEAANNMIGASNMVIRGELTLINGDSTNGSKLIQKGNYEFEKYYRVALQNITVDGERQLLEKVQRQYATFKSEVDSASSRGIDKEIGWFLQRFIPLQEDLKGTLQEVITINQESLKINAAQMEIGASRAIMPGLIAICVGIIFIVLFNYFVNLYFINPILRITSGIDSYLKHSIPFRVKVDTKDEVDQLRLSVEKLIAQNKTYKLDE